MSEAVPSLRPLAEPPCRAEPLFTTRMGIPDSLLMLARSQRSPDRPLLTP
jgi:hypothetical protein